MRRFKNVRGKKYKFKRRSSNSAPRDFTTEVKNEPTFCGVYTEYYDEISQNWNEDTKNTYQRDYDAYIFPHLNDRPLKEYERKDFYSLLEKLQETKEEEGRACSENTVAHINHIIRKVLKVAAKHGICEDVLWGTKGVLSDDKALSETKQYERLRKSLTIKEEFLISEEVLTNHMQRGQDMGLAMMFCMGLRNAEACGVNFGDVWSLPGHPDMKFIIVYKTTQKGTNTLKPGGKTPNFARFVPLAQRLEELIAKRRHMLEGTGEYSTEEIDRMPIACFESNFQERCSSEKLTVAGASLFSRIKMSEQELAMLDEDISNSLGKKDEDAVKEKDPTVYLFRRNLGTHLYILGLGEGEIQYLLGHDIEKEYEKRSYFRNDEKLMQLYRKMSKRPIVNPMQNNIECLDNDRWLDLQDTGDTSIEIAAKHDEALRFKLTANQREPGDSLTVSLTRGRATVKGSFIKHARHAEYSRTINILPLYNKRYVEEVARLRRSLEK